MLVPLDYARHLGPTTLSVPKAALLGLLAGLVLRRSDPRVLAAPAARLFLVCGAAVVAATALSIAQAAYLAEALRETLKSIEYVVLFSAVLIAAREDRAEAPLRLAFSAGTVLVAVSALAQEVLGAPSVLAFAGHAIPRISGVLEGPNQLAGYLGITLCVVTAYVGTGRRPLVEAVALALGSLALVLTFSRAGTVATLGAVALTAALRGRKTLGVAAVVASGGVLAGVASVAALGYAATGSFAHGLALFGRYASTADAAHPGAVGTRGELWHAALTLWRRHPLLGIGAGNFERELGRAGFPRLRTHANSLYLQALVEGGVPLLAATLALVAASLARFARGPLREPLVAAALAASAAFAAHQIFDFLVFFPKVGEEWWILLALGAARCDARRPAAARA